MGLAAMEMDLLNADQIAEERKHKLKKLVQAPNSYFLDVKSPYTMEVFTIFSHSHTVVTDSAGNVLAVPTGGKIKLSVGTAWRRKGDRVTHSRLVMSKAGMRSG